MFSRAALPSTTSPRSTTPIRMEAARRFGFGRRSSGTAAHITSCSGAFRRALIIVSSSDSTGSVECTTRETCSSRVGSAHVLDVPHRRDTMATGQVMEFRVWTELIQQSRGALHVFLPLLDLGLDAVIHRLTDGEYIPVQVKGRAAAGENSVEITIVGSRLVDDR